ncbi:heavy metal translocating P-type ATPase [Moraxella macacae 0408225]|uniref:Heavy metal translocating P-type ATPase n=1 Tax=Moraxella macacae 0408225 TaxID=1230338 RepID=L2F707_9GAMM|nr:heavy metal translocating P-type ATPase [Moraxella macacae]ELA08546.1 heavy metal translocating P-type ATPase [Moraxella macacae 0408225]
MSNFTTTYQHTELILPPDGHCFHCGDPLPKQPFFSTILGKERPMCCLGCQLASQSIVESGLEQYYLDRSEINRTAKLPDSLYELKAYDHEDIKAQFVYTQQGSSVAELSVSNLRCSACAWLIETQLSRLNGLQQCQVNLTNQRMRVLWNEEQLPISQILSTIQQIGYNAKPYRQDTHEAMLRRDNRKMLFQLGIAALGAMQAMMFAVGLYFGEYTGMADNDREFLRWVSLFVSIPVFFIAGLPFFQSAFSALKVRQVNMDVPISLAIVITFCASLYATLTHTGETYYDSVSMLIFFLLAGKYVEHNARVKASGLANDLVVVEPLLVAKLGQAKIFDKNDTDYLTNLKNLNQQYQHIPNDSLVKPNLVSAQNLQIGDIVRIDAGASVISDGILLSTTAAVSQSLLTGESDLIVKKLGDDVIGGSQNDSQPFIMQVTTLPKDSQMGVIDRLVNRALSEKPQVALKADKLARWFVARVLLIASVVFCAWYVIDPGRAIWVTVAVLVATCPCALSLATPIALTVATNRLASLGFLATRGHAITTLAGISHVAFDKTGTLTYGQPNLLAVEIIATQQNDKPQNSEPKNSDDVKNQLLAIAGSLEVGSRHPIAYALLEAARQLHLPTSQDLQHIVGGGVQANIEGHRYRLGHFAFATDCAFATDKALNLPNLAEYQASMSVTLSRWQDNHWQALAHFYFHDKIREQAFDTIQALKNQGISVLMLTGDPSEQADKVALQLGIDVVYKGLSPDEKATHIQALQNAGHIVQMVGDGINDAPVLAKANISTAMAGVADLAQVSGDSLVLNGEIQTIADAYRVAGKTDRIISQNFRWALGYNMVVLIPAGFGYVPPWAAAIGMSLSSLFVVLNALRLKRA